MLCNQSTVVAGKTINIVYLGCKKGFFLSLDWESRILTIVIGCDVHAYETQFRHDNLNIIQKGKERKKEKKKERGKKGKERKGKERKLKERKGKERKGKERKGKERKGKERKGKERKKGKTSI